jgi:hypothetical protein
MTDHNLYKQPRSRDKYVADAVHGDTSPVGSSHGMRSLPTGRKGQTILATGANNHQGRGPMNIENSLLDEKFAGGIDHTAALTGPARVEDEHGYRGLERETQSARMDRQDAERARSFAANRFVNRLPPLGE